MRTRSLAAAQMCTPGHAALPRLHRTVARSLQVPRHLALLLLGQGLALENGLPSGPDGMKMVDLAFEAAIAQERLLAQRTNSAQACACCLVAPACYSLWLTIW